MKSWSSTPLLLATLLILALALPVLGASDKPSLGKVKESSVVAVRAAIGVAVFVAVVAVIALAICFCFKCCCFKYRSDKAAADRAAQAQTEAQDPENFI